MDAKNVKWKMKFEIENQKGELKMENENQKPKLSLDDIFNIRYEICNSIKDGCTNCPFNKSYLCSSLSTILEYEDEIKAICEKWEMNNSTIIEWKGESNE